MEPNPARLVMGDAEPGVEWYVKEDGDEWVAIRLERPGPGSPFDSERADPKRLPAGMVRPLYEQAERDGAVEPVDGWQAIARGRFGLGPEWYGGGDESDPADTPDLGFGDEGVESYDAEATVDLEQWRKDLTNREAHLAFEGLFDGFRQVSPRFKKNVQGRVAGDSWYYKGAFVFGYVLKAVLLVLGAVTGTAVV